MPWNGPWLLDSVFRAASLVSTGSFSGTFKQSLNPKVYHIHHTSYKHLIFTKIQWKISCFERIPFDTFWITLISMTFFQFFLPKNGWEDHPFFFPFFPKLQEFLFLPSMSFGSKRPPTVPNPAPWSSRAKDHQLSPPGSRAVAFINTHVTYLLFKTGCFCLDTSKKGGFSDFWTINSGGLGCVLYLNYLELQWLWDLMSCWVWCAVVSKKAQMVCRVVAIKLDEFCCPPKSKFKTVRIPPWDSWAISCENQCSTYFMLLESQ